MNKNILSTRDICLISIFTAIICVLSPMSIPMPYGVPMTLQTLVIMFTGIVLGPKKGTLAALVYVLLGAVGIPVFAGYSGGLAAIVGPTGGFILSFPIMAFTAGVGASKESKSWLIIGLVVGVIINYLCGIIMFSAVTSSSLRTAFVACVLPFIPIDTIKLIIAAFLGYRIKNMLMRTKVLV